MKEVKFRAWNKFDDSGMVSWEDLKRDFWWCLEDTGDYDIMQFTGLKDKNGKEIYEGDIVKRESYNFVRPWSDQPDKVYKREKPEINIDFVEFYNEDAQFRLHKWKIGNMTSYEVIGNIHENPELLENK